MWRNRGYNRILFVQNNPSVLVIEARTPWLESFEEGAEDARLGRKANLWKIRNKGYQELRCERDWTIGETEESISKHQECYMQGYLSQFTGKEVKYVKILKSKKA